MKINLSKRDYINKLVVHAVYYWFVGDKFNARNALAAAVHLVKELETPVTKRKDAKVALLNFPAKRAASYE